MIENLDMALCALLLAARSVAGRFSRWPEGGGLTIAARFGGCRMWRGPASNALYGA